MIQTARLTGERERPPIQHSGLIEVGNLDLLSVAELKSGYQDREGLNSIHHRVAVSVHIS